MHERCSNCGGYKHNPWESGIRRRLPRTEEPSQYVLTVYVDTKLDIPLENLSDDDIERWDFDSIINVFMDLLTEAIGREPDGTSVGVDNVADFEWHFDTLAEAKKEKKNLLNDPRFSKLHTKVWAF